MECGAGLSDGMNSSSRSGVNERPSESVKLFSRGMASCNLRQNEILDIVPWYLQVGSSCRTPAVERNLAPQ